MYLIFLKIQKNLSAVVTLIYRLIPDYPQTVRILYRRKSPKVLQQCLILLTIHGVWLKTIGGETVYSTETGNAVPISELGELPENVTFIAPDGEYQRWDGSQWVTDEEAKRDALINQAAEKKTSLLKQTGEQIAILQDAVDFGEATPEEQEQLTALRKLRIKLNRIQPENAPDIDWSDFE